MLISVSFVYSFPTDKEILLNSFPFVKGFSENNQTIFKTLKSLSVGKIYDLICHMTKSIDPGELLTVTQAAEERGTTRQAINYLIRQGRLETVEIAGKRFISRSVLAHFKPEVGGRPPKPSSTEKTATRKAGANGGAATKKKASKK